MPQDPKIRNLRGEICMSTKRRQNPMEFGWFCDHFSFCQKHRIGPNLISRFSVIDLQGLIYII